MVKFLRLPMPTDKPSVSLRHSQRKMVDHHKMALQALDPHSKDHREVNMASCPNRIDLLDQMDLLPDCHHQVGLLQGFQVTVDPHLEECHLLDHHLFQALPQDLCPGLEDHHHLVRW